MKVKEQNKEVWTKDMKTEQCLKIKAAVLQARDIIFFLWLSSSLTSGVFVHGAFGPEDSHSVCVALGDVHGELVALWERGGALGPQHHDGHVLQICTFAKQKGSYRSILHPIDFKEATDNFRFCQFSCPTPITGDGYWENAICFPVVLVAQWVTQFLCVVNGV